MNQKVLHYNPKCTDFTPWEIFFLLLTWTLASQFSPATMDTIRDIYQANAIASGESFPLTGPQLAHTIHLGPLWFYVLAIPAVVFGSWSSMAFLAFFLSALKFWLAFAFGRKLHSTQLGIFFALFLALPSWSSIQLIIWTHTIVLETALLLYLLSLRRSFLFPGAGNWFLTGFCFSLALHAHPTALPYLVLLLLAWRPLIQKWYWIVCLTLGIAVLFLPYGFEQLVNGFPDLDALQNYYAAEFTPGGATAMLKLLYSVVVIGPNLYYKTALPANVAAIAITVHWLLILASLSLCLLNLRTTEILLKRLLVGGVIMLLIVVVAVTLMRGRIPWHLAYAPSFALSFLYAVVATIACGRDNYFRFRASFSVTIIMLFLITVSGVSHKIYSSTIRFQSAVLNDVKNLQGPWSFTGLEIPAYSSSTHGEYLCRQAPVVLHGPYAALVDAHVGIEAEMSCGRKSDILIGGTTTRSGYSHIVGITVEMSEILGLNPVQQVGNVYLYEPLEVSAAGLAILLAEGDLNPPRTPFIGGNPEPQKLELAAAGPSALLVSTPVGPYLDLKILEVSCNGSRSQLAIRSNYSWLYQCDESNKHGPTKWQVLYESSADLLIDAVLLPANY